jgi:hypothetical protein
MKDKKPAYIVIQFSPEVIECIVEKEVSTSLLGKLAKVQIKLPSGKIIPLPQTDTQIFEFKNGKLIRSKLYLDYYAFNKFFIENKNRKDYDLKNLEKFITTLPKQPAKSTNKAPNQQSKPHQDPP